MQSMILAFVLALLSPTSEQIADPDGLSALPEPVGAYYSYLKERRLKCLGDSTKIAKPVEIELGGRKFIFSGDKFAAKEPDSDGVVSLGVLGALKDFSPETRKALKRYLDRFQKSKVDAIVLLGDIAATEFELTQILLFCAQRNLPILALIGNSEGRSAFNRAVLASLKVTTNVVNFDLVRTVDMGGAYLVSLPGYINRAFVHQSAGCTYKPKDVEAMGKLVEGLDKPVVLLSHGPPAGEGKAALDVAAEAGNVGDVHLAGFIREKKIHFGVFSHILEAGGRAIDAAGKPVASKSYHSDLYINTGTANPLPWQLNNGKLSCGTGAIFKVKGDKASYELIKHPCK